MSPIHVSDSAHVSPQIGPEDVAGLAAQGFTTIVCNRPDSEVPEALSSRAIKAACETAGVAFVNNPMSSTGLEPDMIRAQARALASTEGKVLAYCASGTRSAILWAFATAAAGRLSAEEIVLTLARAGYPMGHLLPQIEAFSARD